MTGRVRYTFVHGASISPEEGIPAFHESRAPDCPE